MTNANAQPPVRLPAGPACSGILGRPSCTNFLFRASSL